MADRKLTNLPAALKDQIQERSRRRLKGNVGSVNADSYVVRNDPAPKLRSERRPLDQLKDADRRARRALSALMHRTLGTSS